MEAIPDSLNPEALLAHADWVRALARTLVADPHRADDVVQEAWVDALESPPRDSRNVRGWLASVVRNAARQVGRSEARRETRERAVAREEALPDTADLVARASLQRDLVGHVLALEEPYRRTVLLRFFQELEVHEIAEKEGVPLATVRTRLQRGVAKLRERLDRSWGDRSSWCAALAALARMPGKTGTLAMSSAAGSVAWIAGVAGCLAVAGAVWWIWPGNSAPAPKEVLASVEGRPVDPQVVEPDSRSGLTPPDAVDRAPAPSSAPTAAAGAPGPGTELPRTRVRGRVVDVRGNPIAGLRVRARDRVLPRRDGDLIRWRLGVTSHWVPVDPEIQRALREDPDVLERVVNENGNPPGLKEALLGIDLSTPGSTAADGSFDLVASGTDIEVECADEAWIFACDGWLEMRTIRVFVAAPAIEVSGAIVDQAGAPIEAAHAEFGVSWKSLEMFPLTLEGTDEARSWMAITEADGRFHLARIPAITRTWIRGSKKGYLTQNVPEPGSSVANLTIVLPPEQHRTRPHVRGIVLDEQGTVVEGSTVRLGQDESSTDASGSFDIEVTAGLYHGTPLTAMKRNMQAAVIERFDEQFSGEPEGVEGVVLRLGGEALSISGRILDAEGKPCSGWKVDLEGGTPFGTSNINLEAATTGRVNWKHIPETDAEGRFRIEGLRDRTYRIQAWSDETCLVLVSDAIAAGSIGVELSLSPDAVRPILRGRVVSKRGLPVPAAELSIARVTSRSPDGGYSFERCRSVLTDASGRFDLREVPRRNVLLSTQGSMFETVNVEIPADASGDDVRNEVDVQCRFRLEPRSGDAFDHFQILEASGQVLRVTMNLPRSRSIFSNVHRGEEGFPTCTVSEQATVLVLYQGEQELRRVPLDLHPGELQIVVP